MADASEKEKAEKLAAAKKRVEQLKKQKAKKSGGAAKKDKDKKEEKEEKEEEKGEQPTETKAEAAVEEPDSKEEPVADGEAAAAEAEDTAEPLSPRVTSPSLSQQSKARSASFRQGNAGPLSPEGETAPDIYRKHVARIEELEKENKRLGKEVSDAEKRWQKAEEQLSDIKDGDGDVDDGAKSKKAGGDEEIEQLKSEITALKRQNTQLQSRPHHRSPSIANSSSPKIPPEVEAQLASKSATIENMELEISRLRSQVERLGSSGSAEQEQITALEDKLARSEQAASKSQRELGDLKRNLERTSEKAVREGSERTSAETKLRTLQKELDDVKAEKEELVKKSEALDKKVAALTTLHKEHDSRSQTLRREKDQAEKELQDLKSKVEKLESENNRLRKKDSAEGGGDDDGVDELEDEERQRLEKKVRDLESEVYDLRRGIWHQKRKDMEVGPDAEGSSPGGGFTNVDLSGGLTSPTGSRNTSVKPGGIGDFFASGLNALTGAGQGGEDEGFLEDDDVDFDEDAFRRAQEEDAKKRIERIKEIKRGLKNWEGWRLDLVEHRTGGGEGVGEVFEV